MAVTPDTGSAPTAKALGPACLVAPTSPKPGLQQSLPHTHHSQSRRLSWPWPRCPWPGGAGPTGRGRSPRTVGPRLQEAPAGPSQAQSPPPRQTRCCLRPLSPGSSSCAGTAPTSHAIGYPGCSRSLTGLISMARAVIGLQIVTGPSYTVASFLRKRAGLKHYLSTIG